MAWQTLVTLDLKDDAAQQKREAFYRVLEQARWTKVPDLSTAWRYIWPEGAHPDDSAILDTLADAAKATKLTYTVAFHHGPGAVVVPGFKGRRAARMEAVKALLKARRS